VLIFGGLAANWLAGLVRGATAKSGLGNADLLANIARIATWAFAIVVALDQIGIARDLVNALFIASVGAVALALGLAFGIGGRDTAAEVVRNWYERSRGLGTKAGEAAEQVRHDVRSERPH
jgi:small-conductance mechanosensitive channel